MKSFAVLTLLALLFLATPASASEIDLDQMGLSDMTVLDDDAGLDIRGSGYVRTSGFASLYFGGSGTTFTWGSFSTTTISTSQTFWGVVYQSAYASVQ
jgi:hypothetical protein